MCKIIYLDQNKWIGLARQWYGKENDPLKEKIIKLIDTLSKENKIIIPFSVVNFIETVKPEDENRREKLARFMYKISQGYSILPFHSVRNFEIKNAISQTLDLQQPYDIQKIAVAKEGLAYSLGSEIEIPLEFQKYKDELIKVINSEDTFVALVKDLIDRDFINDTKQEDVDILNTFEEGRKKIIDKYDRLTCLKIALSDMLGILLKPLVICLREMDIDVRDFADKISINHESILKFFFSIPTMDIWINLNASRDWDMDRKIDKNDTWDMGFLAMAIPYCDVVVAERYFVNKSIELKFDIKYKTLITKDFQALYDYLSAL